MKSFNIYPALLLLLTISCFYPMDPMDPMDPEDCVNPDTERFLADYLGTFQCREEILIGVLDSDSLFFTIKEPVSDEDCNKVILSLIIEGLPVDLEGFVDGNTLTINDMFNDFAIPEFPNPVDPTMNIILIADVEGDGLAQLSDNDSRIDGELILDITAVDGSFSIRDTCALVGNKL